LTAISRFLLPSFPVTLVSKNYEKEQGMSSVVLGTDVETGQVVRLGDIERRSGSYFLGKMGMGKSALAVNIALQDIANGHGLFFLDPHGEAINNLLRRGDYLSLQLLGTLFDVEDVDYSFGINLLECSNIANRKARMATYTKAYNVFLKLWEDKWGPWLQLILQNVLWAFIENQGYTLADVPMFLNHRNVDFRNHIVDNIKYNPAVADFWRYEFFERRESSVQERVEAALTRINTLLTYPDVRDIVGQAKTTLNFETLLTLPNILLFKLPANTAEDVKEFIGTILLSELVHAVRNRPEDERTQFSIFVDEFHNFASSDHMATIVTEGRKFGVASTFIHVERFGQLAHNQKLLGATLATANKAFFQLIVPDAQESAPEFAKEVEATEKRTEPILVFSTHPVEDIWDKGHPNEIVTGTSSRYVRFVEELRRNPREAFMYFDPTIPTLPNCKYVGDLHWDYFDDWEYYAANADMLRRGLAALNRHYYWWMKENPKKLNVKNDDICKRALEIVECLGGLYGIRPAMEPYISEPMRHALLRALQGFRAPSCYEHVERKYSRTSRTFPSHNIIHEGKVKRTLELPNFPRTLLSLDSSDMNQLLRQIGDLRWHANRPMGEVDFYRRRRLFHAIVGLPNPDPWPDIECIPTTFTDLAHLHAIRQLALFIGMLQYDIENLISWRPRPLDETEKELFKAMYMISAIEPYKTLLYHGLNSEQVSELCRRVWVKYYADVGKIPQQVIDTNRESKARIYVKMFARAGWNFTETLYFLYHCFWVVGDCLDHKPIKVPSGNYDESLRVERPQHDLITDTVLAMTRLPRYQAYVKIIEEIDGVST
jgi:hypothetical protein